MNSQLLHRAFVVVGERSLTSARWQSRAALATIGVLLAGLIALASPNDADAFKPRGHIFAANKAIEPILAGRDVVTIKGRDYAVPPQVADAIRTFPADYRGGVVGPDMMPDIPGGQGNIHPDTRTENGTRPDPGPGGGRSFTWEWLQHVYDSGWDAYRRCGGCAEGKRALAYSYGFLTHAAGDIWGHSFVNEYAHGVFPQVGEVIGDAEKRRHAVRHVVVEGYIDRHTPNTDLALDAPLGFVHSTLIDNGKAAELGRGQIIDSFMALRGRLEGERAGTQHTLDGIQRQIDTNNATSADLRRKVDSLSHDLTNQDMVWVEVCIPFTPICTRERLPDIADAPTNLIEAAALSAEIVVLEARRALLAGENLLHQGTMVVHRAKRDYLAAWIDDIDSGLAAYPKLSLDIARALFTSSTASGEPHADVGAATAAAERYVANHMLSMLGFPDQFGQFAGLILDVGAWVESVLGPFAEPLRAAKANLVNYMLKSTIGMDADELKSYITSPESNINRSVDPVALPPDTSRKIDAVMGLPVDGVQHPTYKYDPERFPVMRNAIEMSKLVLLDRDGLSRLIGGGAQFPRDNVMLGWPRSIDGEFQWLAKSPRDGLQYGEGNFYLWQNCRARHTVFRSLFRDWRGGANFPDPEGDACAPPAPENTARPQISGTAVEGDELSCSDGTWDWSPTSFSHRWLRGETRIEGAAATSYRVTSADVGQEISCEVIATNAGGDSAPARSASVVASPRAGGSGTTSGGSAGGTGSGNGGPTGGNGGAGGGATSGGGTGNSGGANSGRPRRGKCSQLRGKKRARCIRRHCAGKRGKARRRCVKRVTRGRTGARP